MTYAVVVAVLDARDELDADDETDRDNAGEKLEDGLDDTNALTVASAVVVRVTANGEIEFRAEREPDEDIVLVLVVLEERDDELVTDAEPVLLPSRVTRDVLEAVPEVHALSVESKEAVTLSVGVFVTVPKLADAVLDAVKLRTLDIEEKAENVIHAVLEIVIFSGVAVIELNAVDEID